MRKIRLCQYSYDPLDRLVKTSPVTDAESQRFYCRNRLITEIQDNLKLMIFHHDDQLLAQRESNGVRTNTALLATDQQESVFHVSTSQPTPPIAYSPYGHRPSDHGMLSLLEFNGERRDPVTGYYLLGNGHRAFNPVLMRFNTTDKLSPFGRGGLNCYAYCSGNPIGRQDRNGRYWRSVVNVPKKPLKRLVRRAQLPDSKAKQKPTLYKNTRPERFSSEFEAFQEAIKTDPIKVISVIRAQDLEHLGGSLPRRFVLTPNNQLLIDPSIDLERRGTNHAILASYGKSESAVLSAGTISASPRRATIWNDSGHYRPHASALEPVARFLNGLGVEVISVRQY